MAISIVHRSSGPLGTISGYLEVLEHTEDKSRHVGGPCLSVSRVVLKWSCSLCLQPGHCELFLRRTEGNCDDEAQAKTLMEQDLISD
ncbi:hypothetical protein PGIGA_G00042210 [Pangasianodon gigas]|uniref:Uncharacterized protein n=1 Tax=Pangasianodon gigas TaxID=30993 RepID=A0ACC5X0G9_PANGG|nr:hypothetical protein [Pangasianodon gigas]